MAALAQASLSTDERTLLDRFARRLRSDLDDELHALWLFGSRARGEHPLEDSDIDLLVLVEDATWDGRDRVHTALWTAARELGLEDLALTFSLHINTPAWLEQRRDIRSFFIAEVDRDKIVL